MEGTLLQLAAGLVCVMMANILLGATAAQLAGEFDRDKLADGLRKILPILGGLGFMFAAAKLNGQVVVLDTGTGSLTLMDALHLVLLAGFGFYAAQALEKLCRVIGIRLHGETDE